MPMIHTLLLHTLLFPTFSSASEMTCIVSSGALNSTHSLTPDIFSRTIPQELQHISDWAKHHNLKLNQSKSLEIGLIINLRTPPTSAATFLTRVDSLTVLGVTFNSKLRFDLHVSIIIDKAARARSLWFENHPFSWSYRSIIT